MQVTLSGYTGRATEAKSIFRKDGNGSFTISETSLAVKVAEDATDWYKLKFVGDSLAKAASYITKGCQLSVVGILTFEHWEDKEGNLCSKAVVTVSEVQLPAKAAAV
jgi:single-stranded DNA-binding protein